ncbi:unnamed protein product [Amaranthus hypochondriacus]
MSNILCLVMICLLCLCFTSSTTANRRLLPAFVTQNLPQHTHFKHPIKQTIEKVKVEMKTMSDIIPSDEVSITNNEQDQMPKNKENDGAITDPYSKNSHKLSNYRKFPKRVSWRVPKTKDEVSQTGFNLDYAPPKVHPPTHN